MMMSKDDINKQIVWAELKGKDGKYTNPGARNDTIGIFRQWQSEPGYQNQPLDSRSIKDYLTAVSKEKHAKNR